MPLIHLSLVWNVDNELLTASFIFEEFKEAIFFMKDEKCPKHDGYNPGFYQKIWNICGHYKSVWVALGWTMVSFLLARTQQILL